MTPVTDILERHKPPIFLIVGSIFYLCFCFSCGDLNKKQASRVTSALEDSLTSTTETWNLDLELMEEGQRRIRLTGSYAASFNTEKTNETRISGPVHVKVYDDTSAVKTWVNADSAIYQAESSQFELYGDVRVRTRDERRLQSEYLKWDQAENKISTPHFVIITTPQDSIAGTGFTGESDLSHYTIKQVSGEVTVD